MYVTKNVLKLDIFFIKKCISFYFGESNISQFIHFFLGKITRMICEVFIVFFLFKTFSLFAFVCHPESIFWQKHLLLKRTFKCECWCNMNSLSCPTGSNYKHGRLREGYINGQLDTRREQIKWLDDITYTQYKQLDIGEDRRWLGNEQGKLELAG